MRKIILICIISAIPILATGCGGKRIRLDKDNRVTQNGLSLGAKSLKAKKDRYFIELSLINESEQAVMLKLREAQCFRGDSTGEFKRGLWNSSSKPIRLEAHQRKEFKAVCEHDKGVDGEFRVKFPFSTAKSEEESGSHNGLAIEWKHDL